VIPAMGSWPVRRVVDDAVHPCCAEPESIDAPLRQRPEAAQQNRAASWAVWRFCRLREFNRFWLSEIAGFVYFGTHVTLSTVA